MKDWEVNIKKVKEVPDVHLEDPDLESEVREYVSPDRLKKVHLPESTIKEYEEIFKEDKNFWDKVGNFFRAENGLGRGFKVIKDFALLFAPKWASVGYNTVDEFVIQNIVNDMPNNEESKSTSKSSTIITFGLVFLAGLLMQFGVIPADMIELSPDAQWVLTGSGIIGIIFRLITDKPVKLGKSIRRILGRKSD